MAHRAHPSRMQRQYKPISRESDLTPPKVCGRSRTSLGQNGKAPPLYSRSDCGRLRTSCTENPSEDIGLGSEYDVNYTRQTMEPANGRSPICWLQLLVEEPGSREDKRVVFHVGAIFHVFPCVASCLWTSRVGHSSSRSIAMSSSDRGGIQALLAAEQDAQRIVANARAAKTARLRQAKEEAEREVAQYRAQREAEFRKKLSDSSGDSGANVKRLESETNDKINRLSDDAAKVAAEVTALLMNYVITVKN
ncbi:uncharacterized protein [Physcomitrium patens]|uniref:uncharacterized protein isoform X2 n=1 Tax=Physcomitrium patens TaxID=3218 RepID=UPI000D163C88|nr:uncharacterized protein LOC112292277 isoform X2 [Physcomitrium patens]|eukprot:XP_024396354.1 uncharacterized protein LOC112292277 isoform X2 [Physcomitrella patens]